jgi:hypothetical protein
MILLCAEARENVFWIDPRGRQYRYEDFVLLAFSNITSWERLLDEATAPVVCARCAREVKCSRWTGQRTSLACVSRADKPDQHRPVEDPHDLTSRLCQTLKGLQASVKSFLSWSTRFD